jgi:hypothetical protein
MTHPGVVAVRNALLCPRPIRGIVDGALDNLAPEDGSERGEPEHDMGVSSDPPTRGLDEMQTALGRGVDFGVGQDGAGSWLRRGAEPGSCSWDSGDS